MNSNEVNSQDQWDVIVVGGGYAGTAAAMTLSRALHSVLVFDDNRPVNRWNTKIHHTPTWEGVTSDVTRENCKQDLLRSPSVKLVERSVVSVDVKEDGSFGIKDTRWELYSARKLLIACGVEHDIPALKGYEEYFTTGILPCMFQFGYEQRSAMTAGLLAIDIISIPHFARMLADDGQKFSKSFTIYTNGNSDLENDLQAYCKDAVMRIDGRKILCLRQGNSSDDTGNTGSEVELEFEGGATKTEGFLVHRPGTTLTSPIADQLGLKISEHGNIEVTSPFCHTSHPGIFAAGDCASPMKIISNAFAMGVYAANGAARELPKRVLKSL